MTVRASILNVWHNRAGRSVIIATAITGAVCIVPALMHAYPPQSETERQADWPACELSTELSTEKLRAKGHTMTYERLGARGGMWRLDGHYIGMSSSDNAPFIACSTRRIVAPLDGVPRY